MQKKFLKAKRGQGMPSIGSVIVCTQVKHSLDFHKRL